MSETLSTASARAPSGRSAGWLLLALGLVLLLSAAERQVRVRLAESSPASGAEWIWADGRVARYTGPRAFYAVRDVHLDTVPPAAEARVLADEEYLLWINGRRVGSNSPAWIPVPSRAPIAPKIVPRIPSGSQSPVTVRGGEPIDVLLPDRYRIGLVQSHEGPQIAPQSIGIGLAVDGLGPRRRRARHVGPIDPA